MFTFKLQNSESSTYENPSPETFPLFIKITIYQYLDLHNDLIYVSEMAEAEIAALYLTNVKTDLMKAQKECYSRRLIHAAKW